MFVLIEVVVVVVVVVSVVVVVVAVGFGAALPWDARGIQEEAGLGMLCA